MKKIISSLTALLIISSTTISVISCDDGTTKYQDRWHDVIICDKNSKIYDITTYEEGAKPEYKVQYLFSYNETKYGKIDWSKCGPSIGYLYEGLWKGNYIDTFFKTDKYNYSFYGNINLPHGAKNPSSEKYKATN